MNDTETLNEMIDFMKLKQSDELKVLKAQCRTTYESLKPLNLIKSTFQEVKKSADLKHKLGENAIGLTIGYLVKKVFFKTSHNPVKKIAGALVQVAVTNMAVKHADTIMALGSMVIETIAGFKRRFREEPDRYEDSF